MKFGTYLTGASIAALLLGGLTTSPALANDSTPAENSSRSVAAAALIPDRDGSNEVAVVTADEIVRSIAPDEFNSTSTPGLSATISKAPSDRAIVSADARTFLLLDAAGAVLLSSSNPEIGVGERLVPAKFVLDGDTLVVTPIDPVRGSRAQCASSLWGNIIFNVGMAGVCAALAVGTVVGGVVCTAALIGANAGINFDSGC